ncbi:glycosyltransferase family 4 protein [Brevibacillus fluminis]|uniref:glycosyltransferase family 4 protein n=1 Tax=Brevibacillus fluminis TaxID=511487 RepID=UPI003F8B77D3
MKIVQIITRSEVIGGAHVHVLDIAKHLVKKGNEVIIYAGGEGPFTEEIGKLNLPYRALAHLVRPISVTKDWQAFWEIREALQRDNPQLVATHSSKAGLLGRLAARSLGIPAIFTAHGWAFTEGVPPRRRLFYRMVERLAAPFATRIITVSEYDRELALRYRVGSQRKVVTVHNGVDGIDRGLLADPGREQVRLIMIARFEEQKDHRTLLTALSPLRHLPWELDLVGDGPLLAPMKQLAAELGLGGKVHFYGARRDIPERLAKAQIFLLISKWEGFPLSILEAMRAGLPVIASSVGGVSEAIVEGVTGCLIPQQDARTLQEKLERLLLNPDLRKSMGKAGMQLYQEQFTVDMMMKKMIDVYEDALGRSSQLQHAGTAINEKRM